MWRLWATVVLLGLGGRAGAADGEAARPQQKIADFALRDSGGKPCALADFKDSSIVVVAFLGTQCPLAQLYLPRLNKMAALYRDHGVVFLGINSNAQDSTADLAAYAQAHAVAFPLLKDPGNVVADQFDAQRTPEVFVLDRERVVRYRGRIDDQYGVGTMRPEPKQHDLRQVIDQLIAGKAAGLRQTEAVGCRIGRVRKPSESGEVTYARQIAGILNARCVECHRAGEIGPFPLTDYAEVAGWAETIAEVVAAGRMPPWQADPKYGTFVGDRHLTAKEKKLIAEWAKAGAPQGNPAEAPQPPRFLESGWKLPRQPDLVVPVNDKPVKVPAEGTIEYRYFTADPHFAEDKWVSAAEVLPGNRAVVHHMLVFAMPQGLREAIEDGTTDGFLAAYVPGLRPMPYPAGMAKRIKAGSKLLFQVHYITTGIEQFDSSQVGLVFAEPQSVQYEVVTSSVKKRNLLISPGAPHYRAAAESSPSLNESLLLTMMPHMHLRGAAFTYEVLYPNGKTETLLDVPRYDFNWQNAYRLATPLALPVGTRLRCTGYFDNSKNNPNNPNPTKSVRWGPQARDEMMVGYFDVAFRRGGGGASGAAEKKDRSR